MGRGEVEQNSTLAQSSRPTGPSRGVTPRLHEQVAVAVFDLIASGRIETGSKLTETAIANRLHVSRAPARQALLALAQQGAVRKASGRGYIVCPVATSNTASGVPLEPRPVKFGPTWQHIYDDVESEISSRISFGSWRIKEDHLARAYSVSRTVARDVLSRLQQCGIVSKDDRGRWVAPSLTPERVIGLYEVRSLLEPAALKKAAAHVSPQHVDAMLKDIDKAIADPRATFGKDLDRLEEALHVDLLNYCRNQALMDAIRAPQSLLIAHRFLYVWTGQMFAAEPFLPEHREVLQNLRDGKIAAAENALAQHLRISSDRAIARVAAVSRDVTLEPIDYLSKAD